MKEMTKRERVEAVLNFREPDRVPVYDLLRNDAVIEYYAGEKLTIDGLRVTCKAIGRCLDMTRSIRGPAKPGNVVDEDGFVRRHERWTSWIEERPFRDLKGAAEWIKKDIKRKREWRPDSAFLHKFREEFLAMQAMVGDTVILLTESPVGMDIETVAGMDLKEVKERYGHKIFIAGGIDASELLPHGTPDEVKEACRAAIRVAGRGFGVFPGLYHGAK